VSVNATHGNVDVASFQLLSKIGTFQLDVQVSFVAAVHKAPQSFNNFPVAQSNTARCQSVELQGQTTSQVLVVYPASLAKSETLSQGCTAVAHKAAQVLNVDKLTLQSLIFFQVAPSNIAIFPDVALAGQVTSQLHDHPLQSAQSCTWNVSTVQLVSVIVTVVVFQALLLVMEYIPFPVGHCTHCIPCSH
jgi:hypothetical protein